VTQEIKVFLLLFLQKKKTPSLFEKTAARKLLIPALPRGALF
jgi:hypothetical protein